MNLSKAGKVAIYVIMILIIQEVVLRICFPIPEVSNFDRINYLELENGPGTYRHMRNQNWYWQSKPDTSYRFVHYLNQYGFRDSEWPVEKSTKKRRILFVGDSFLEGVMADQDQTICDGFGHESGYRFELFNGGMIGTGLASYLRLATDAIPIFKPDHMLLFISANDLGQKSPTIPEYYLTPEYFNKYRPRLVEIVNQLNDESPIKFRWYNRPKGYLPTIASKSNPWSTNESELNPHVRGDLATTMKNGEFSPFRTNNLASEARNYLLNPIFGETFGYLNYFTKKFDCTLTVVYIPSRNLVTEHYLQYEKALCQLNCPDTLNLTKPKYQYHQIALEQECQKHGIPFVNLTDYVRSQEEKSNRMYWNYDDHMRGEAYQIVGKEVFRRWNSIQPSRQSPTEARGW